MSKDLIGIFENALSPDRREKIINEIEDNHAHDAVDLRQKKLNMGTK